MMIGYSTSRMLLADEFIDVLQRSTLAGRRPVDDPECIAAMLAHADLTVTAWEGDRLVGVARSVTDFSYCCYLSDLAVDAHFQGQGIGRELIRQTRALLGPTCRLILLAAPNAASYYPHIGLEKHPSAWVLYENQGIKDRT
ncbi:MAG TPA: GNAT family N-acetyltransferase [Gammaproteobacteria bacterium]|nr:GNAT family N-acetyltransferase [Gammaproteobacteria bacterium]